MSSSETDYCGFSCGMAKDKVQEVLDEIIEFSHYNPEYSLVMLGKIMEMVYETRKELSRFRE